MARPIPADAPVISTTRDTGEDSVKGEFVPGSCPFDAFTSEGSGGPGVLTLAPTTTVWTDYAIRRSCTLLGWWRSA